MGTSLGDRLVWRGGEIAGRVSRAILFQLCAGAVGGWGDAVCWCSLSCLVVVFAICGFFAVVDIHGRGVVLEPEPAERVNMLYG